METSKKLLFVKMSFDKFKTTAQYNAFGSYEVPKLRINIKLKNIFLLKNLITQEINTSRDKKNQKSLIII